MFLDNFLNNNNLIRSTSVNMFIVFCRYFHRKGELKIAEITTQTTASTSLQFTVKAVGDDNLVLFFQPSRKSRHKPHT